MDPLGLAVSVAEPTKIQDRLLGNTKGNISLQSKTIITHINLIPRDKPNTTQWTIYFHIRTPIDKLFLYIHIFFD